MASPNIGGSSNDATGNKLLRKSVRKRIEVAEDRLMELEFMASNRESTDTIHRVVWRQREEISRLEATLASL